jgi:hypothetical protein
METAATECSGAVGNRCQAATDWRQIGAALGRNGVVAHLNMTHNFFAAPQKFFKID